jgi:hypothetical protein
MRQAFGNCPWWQSDRVTVDVPLQLDILQEEAESRIQAAADREQYRVCEKREQEGRDELKERMRARHEALRAKADRIRQGMLSQAGR